MPQASYPDMVRWFSPRQIIRTLADVASATAVTRVFDPRTVEFQSPRAGLIGNWKARRELWLDFAADLGDGWNPTFSIARTIASAELVVRDPSQKKHTLPRAEVLVLGGDLVYPTPRDGNYDVRLVAPFEEALAKAPDRAPTVLAVPGNHDWYDGLREFTRRFCYPGSHFAAWRTRQSRSYFAAALPGGWWLLGVDTQLGGLLDRPQSEFFKLQAKKMPKGSGIILVMPAPDWLHIPLQRRQTTVRPSDQIEEIFGRKPDVCLAGNLHHYRRHLVSPEKRESPEKEESPDEEEAPLQRITAGGGGAFLHQTHETLDRRLRNRLITAASFPPAEDSERYQKRLLLFPFLNLSAGVVPAILYVLIAMTALLSRHADLGMAAFVAQFLQEPWTNLTSPLALVPLLVMCLLFRERRDITSIVLAVGHAAAQLLACALTAYAAGSLASAAGAGDQTWMWWTLILTFPGGWVVGSFVLGLYLWASSLCSRNLAWAYAALRIQDWKSFLRLHVARDGALTIYPIGLRRVARHWRRRATGPDSSALEPEDDVDPPELIEVPIVIRPSGLRGSGLATPKLEET